MEIVNQSTLKAVLFGIIGAALFAVIRGRIGAVDDLMGKLEG
jgi:hypothetical protein